MRIGKHFNFYGRKRGKKLSKLQEHYILTYLPKIALDKVSFGENPNRSKLELTEIFDENYPICLEIGFGGGEHLLSIAKKNKNVGFIGCEPYINGVAMLLPRLFKEDLKNVRIYMGDARMLFEVLPDCSITNLFLLFPDPWPKARHKKRRFISKENLNVLKRVLKLDGLIFIATDVGDYAKHVLETFNQAGNFEWLAESANDWRHPWKDWERTRYYLKAEKSGRETIFLTFRKV